MILADKIIKLRKEHGWSQEELALKLNVSRQSVSKWESMASIPDLEKIIKLSELFGVSTDYLLRDEMEVDPNASEAVDKYEPLEEKVRQVSLEEANTYMNIVEQGAKNLAMGVAVSFITMRWDMAWIIWPVAGISYGVLVAILKAVRNNKKEERL